MARKRLGADGEMPGRQTAESRLAARRDSRRNAVPTRSDRRMDEILAAAARVFRRLGYSNSTLEDVALEVGMNRASLYYYVAAKDELLAELLRGPAFEMTAVLTGIWQSSKPSAEKVREAIAAHMTAFAAHFPELFIFLAENLYLQTVGDPDGDVVENARQYGNVFTEIIKEGQQAGEIRGDLEPRIAMLGIIGMCNWTYRWYREGEGMSLAEIGDQFISLVTGGILARTAPSTV